MAISKDGYRARYYAERKRAAERQGNPLHEGVSEPARMRIARELVARTMYRDGSLSRDFEARMIGELNRVFIRSGDYRFTAHSLDADFAELDIDDFLQAVEIGVSYLAKYRQEGGVLDINIIQSILADDLSVYRLVERERIAPKFQIVRIDNEHLHKVIADRTFELTRIADFASAQNDYADAWRHYSRGDTDDAISNAGKAVESACKAAIKKVDPSSTPENMNLGPLVAELVRLDVIPQQLTHTCTHLEQIFRGSGSLRNQAGTAHGSLDPTSPHASVTLLALRLSGTLIAFLAERWTQVQPASPAPPKKTKAKAKA